MTQEIDSTKYNQLRAELVRLRAEATPDLVAIDRVMAEIDAEQGRLKTADGQHGNNAIRNRWD